MRIIKLGILCALLAAALLALLWVTDVIRGADLGEVAAKTFAVIGIVFAAAFAWRVVRGRVDVPDKTDQPVP